MIARLSYIHNTYINDKTGGYRRVSGVMICWVALETVLYRKSGNGLRMYRGHESARCGTRTDNQGQAQKDSFERSDDGTDRWARIVSYVGTAINPH